MSMVLCNVLLSGTSDCWKLVKAVSVPMYKAYNDLDPSSPECKK